MKKIVMFILMLGVFCLSFTAFGETGEQVCQSLPTWQEQQDCLSRIQGQYVDIKAGNVCIRARYTQARVQCLNVSLNKEYAMQETDFCNQTIYDQDRIDCMQRNGMLLRTDPRSRATLEQINRFSLEGLRAVQAGNAQAAYFYFQKINSLSNQR